MLRLLQSYPYHKTCILGDRKPCKRIVEEMAWRTGLHIFTLAVRTPIPEANSSLGGFHKPKETVFEKPEGMKKFSMLYSKEIYPEFYGIYTRQERRAITPPKFAKAFFEANR